MTRRSFGHAINVSNRNNKHARAKGIYIYDPVHPTICSKKRKENINMKEKEESAIGKEDGNRTARRI